MAVLRVRGFALPNADPVDLYADGDRWTTDPVPRAELVAEGWLLPGLVDAHTHPGAEEPGKPMDEDVLRDDLRAHLAAGVTLIRAPGLAGEPPAWFGQDEESPRAVHAGPWLAQQGQFFEGWGRRPDLEELPAVAAAQAARTGWAKLIADWAVGDDVLPVGVLREVVARVHAAGGRVIVDEIRALVAAGVPPHDALAAASWTARGYLGLAGLTPGAPADAVVFDTDPRADLRQLDAPRAVIARGRLVHHR